MNYVNKDFQNYTVAQRNVVAAQWEFEATLKNYEAAAVIMDENRIQQVAEKCHEALEVLLASKQQMMREYMHTNQNPN